MEANDELVQRARVKVGQLSEFEFGLQLWDEVECGFSRQWHSEFYGISKEKIAELVENARKQSVFTSLPRRPRSILYRAKIRTMEQLRNAIADHSLAKEPYCGSKTMKELADFAGVSLPEPRERCKCCNGRGWLLPIAKKA